MTIAAGRRQARRRTPKSRAFPGLGLLRSTHGLQRATLVLGSGARRGLHPGGAFRAAAGAVRLRPDQRGRRRIRAPAGTVGAALVRHLGARRGRVLAGDLRRPHRADGDRVVADHLAARRRRSRPGVRLSRRLAGPGAGAGDGRAVRDAVAAAGDRGVHRPCGRAVRHAGRHLVGIRGDHGGVCAAVLPRGPQRDVGGQGRAVRRRRPRHRRQHDRESCSATYCPTSRRRFP